MGIPPVKKLPREDREGVILVGAEYRSSASIVKQTVMADPLPGQISFVGLRQSW
jgi:hypothetical protein